MPNSCVRTGSPLFGAIAGFDFPNRVSAIITPQIHEFDLMVYPKQVLFLGYKDQCEKHLSDYPGGVLFNNIKLYLTEN